MTSRWKLLVSLIGIFLLGGITGGLIAFRISGYFPRQADAALTTVVPEQWGPNQLRKFMLQFDLSPDQAEDVKLVIDDAVVELRKIRRKTAIDTAKVLDQMDADIEPLLNAEQLTKFRDLQAKNRERMKKYAEERARKIRAATEP